MKIVSWAAVLLAGLAVHAIGARAQAPAPTLPSTGALAVPTYEAAGLYWQSPGGTAGCDVRYRKSGASAWSQGLALWYDARDGQCRGSLVNLAPNTWYQVELGLAGQAPTRGLVFRTWSNQLPVAKTIAVHGGSGTYNIAEGGSPTGYVVYEGNGATLDAANGAPYNVSINASYVILRGLNLRGAQRDAIRISPNVHDVVIEDNDISGWGRLRTGNWGVDMDSGIRAICSQPTLERVTIQRNRIHDPRYSANSWSDGHPAGPQAVSFSYCGGNHVIRHNEIYSTNGNRFNDALGGEDNFSKIGFPNADSDIYGNRISHAWDDAIEAEGANENVRIWGNYIDRTAIGVATTATAVGPVYIFRNVYNRSQFRERGGLDADDRQVFFKSGGDASLGDGRRYIFHNTMLQATQAGLQYPLGAGAGIGGTGSTQLISNTFSKNNIFHLWKPKGAVYQFGRDNDFASDMYSGHAGDAAYTNGIAGTPVYAAGAGWPSEAGGNYQLAASSPGFGRGVRIPNFNDGAPSPDVGAHQSGTAAMKFGIAASAGSAVSPAAGVASGSLSSLSTRMQVLTGNDVLIGGFIIGGSVSKTVVVRARGPSLASAGITNALANPSLQLVRAADNATIAINDNWAADPHAAALAASGFAPSDPLESAVLVSLGPGAYTAIVSGVGGGTGVGIVEVFEVDHPEAPLAGISTRGQVLTGNDVMIGGFVIQGDGPQTVVVRARGPSLASSGVANPLADPALQLVRAADNVTVATNDNWGSDANAAPLTASGFAPASALDSAILVTLSPGAYTAIVAGVGGGTGVAIVEVFTIP